MPNGLSGLAAKKYNYSLVIVRFIWAVRILSKYALSQCYRVYKEFSLKMISFDAKLGFGCILVEEVGPSLLKY